MNILHVTNLSNNPASGMSAVVPLHIQWQSKNANIYWVNLNRVYVKPSHVEISSDIFVNDEMTDIDQLPKPFNSPDIVVFHGVYFFSYHKLSTNLNKKDIPYIIAPHGSLTEVSMKKKFLKKKLALFFIFNKFVKGANAIQFLTEGEMKASGRCSSKRGLIVPNGCSQPQVRKTGFNSEGKICGIFIGRKSIQHKGLDLLIEACGRIKHHLKANNVTIKIYGPDEESSCNALQAMIDENGLSDYIEMHGAVYDKEKERALLKSDFFVLTSRFEGHPVSLIEALSYGLPCFVTSGTNMSEKINKYAAGWGVETDVNSISNGLVTMLEQCDDFPKYGKNAKLLSQQYDWQNISVKAIQCYRETIG